MSSVTKLYIAISTQVHCAGVTHYLVSVWCIVYECLLHFVQDGIALYTERMSSKPSFSSWKEEQRCAKNSLRE